MEFEELEPTTATMEKAAEHFKAMIHDIPKDMKGLMVLTYGTPDYMVSGNAARQVANALKEKIEDDYPNLHVVLKPHWMKMDLYDIVDDESKQEEITKHQADIVEALFNKENDNLTVRQLKEEIND